MRWTFSGLNLSLAAIAELAGYFLSCSLLRNGNRLHGACWRLFACSHRRHFRRSHGGGRRPGLLLREGLLWSFPPNKTQAPIRAGHFGEFFAPELGGGASAADFSVLFRDLSR